MKKLLTDQFIPCQKNSYQPKFWRVKSIFIASLILILLFGTVYTFQFVVKRNPDLVAAVVSSVLVDLTNLSRAESELTLLSKSDVLSEAAQQKASHMAQEGYFAHESPTGVTPWHWFNEVGYNFVYAGENLAVNFTDSEDVVTAWMNSEGHRANILGEHFTEVGIGIAKGEHKGKPSVFVVQLFGTPALQSSAEEIILITEDTTSEGVILGVTQEISVIPLETTAPSDSFVAVQNTEYTEKDAEPARALEAAPTLSVIERIIGMPKQTASTAYTLIAAFIVIALLLFIFIEPKKQYPKYILLGVFLVALALALLYATNTLVFEEVVIEGSSFL